MKHIRLRRVDVLGLVVTQCAPAERNGPPAAVADREHHPVAKQVPGPPVTVRDGAGFNQWPLQVLAGAVEQGGASAGRVAELVLFNNAVVQAPLFKVVPGEFTLLALQGGLIETAGVIQGVRQCSRLLHFLARALVVGHFHAGPAGQFLYRIGKAQAVELADKADGVAMGATAEAVVKALVRPNVERRRFFIMEGAAGLVVAAGLFQGDT